MEYSLYLFLINLNVYGSALVAQMVKNPPQCRRPRFDPWVRKILLEKG